MSEELDPSPTEAPVVRRGRPRRSPTLEAMVNDPRLAEAAPKSVTRADQRQPTRRRKSRNTQDKYHVDQERIPPGMSYEWKRVTYAGKEDREHQIDTDENGFTPVPADRHPELAGRNAKAGERIERGGLMLMERPMELRQEALEEDAEQAHLQVNTQMRRLKLADDQGHERIINKARRSYGPGALAVED